MNGAIPTQDVQASADPFANPSITNTSQIEAASSGSRLLNLPADLLREIFNHTELLRAGDLLNLTRSCQALHSHIRTSQLYHHVRFMIPNGNSSGAGQAQKFISKLDQHPERSSWVREADFTRASKFEHCWGVELQELLRRLPWLHTLKIQTLCPCPKPLSSFGHSDMNQQAVSCLDKTVSRLMRLTSLQSLTFEDTCLNVRSVALLSHIENLKHLRVRWAYEKTAEADLLAREPDRGLPSTITRLELLTPLLPKDVSVDYILQFYPSLEELSWIICDRGDSKEWLRVPVSQSLASLSHLLVELHLPNFDARTFMSQKLLDLSTFPVLRTLKIHSNMILPFKRPNDEQSTGFDLAKRLPSSLKVLEVAYSDHPHAVTPGSCPDSWIIAKDVSGGVSCLWLQSLVSYKRTYFPQLSEVALRCRTHGNRQEIKLETTKENKEESEWILTKSSYCFPGFSNHLRTIFEEFDISLKYKTSVRCVNDSYYYPIEDEDRWFKRV